MALASIYLETLKNRGITPNFFCSEEYFKFSGVREIVDPETPCCYEQVRIVEEDGGDLLPPLRLGWGGPYVCWLEKEVHADLPGSEGFGRGLERTFLDHQYIYDPKNFMSLEGKHWTTFRKNSRKWPRYRKEIEYTNEVPSPDRIDYLLATWLEGRPEDTAIYDIETLYKFLHDAEHRAFLYEDGQLVGVNTWDYNWKYINFRYCICRPDPFLSEFLRLQFYLSPKIIWDGRWVNDGGTLGNPDLKFFKDRMNPMKVVSIFSWIQTAPQS